MNLRVMQPSITTFPSEMQEDYYYFYLCKREEVQFNGEAVRERECRSGKRFAELKKII